VQNTSSCWRKKKTGRHQLWLVNDLWYKSGTSSLKAYCARYGQWMACQQNRFLPIFIRLSQSPCYLILCCRMLFYSFICYSSWMVQPIVFLSIYFISYWSWLTYLNSPANHTEDLSDIRTLNKILTGFVSNCVIRGQQTQ
jgi:hypothetical protein